MKYILRLAVHEDTWQRQLQDLLALCQTTPIKEVMLMEESHQMLTAPFTRAKHERMAAIYTQMAAALTQQGVAFSINVVTTVGHGDNMVRDEQVLPFQKFVGESLRESHAVYCIADEAWVQYTADICALYAQIKPVRMMIDDDFRSLNHSSTFGCFCPLHMQMLSDALGAPITQQALLDALCAEGEPAQRIKRAWMQTNFAAQCRAAKAIEQAVHAVSPHTQLGLMNSGECAHSVQGRSMAQLLQAFAGEGRQGLSRPAGAAYCDALHRDVVDMHQTTALSMSAVHSDTFWVSEIENYPNTRYTKSIALTKLHMQLQALCAPDAMSLNLYDYLATPFALQSEYADMVVQATPAVNTILQLRRGKTLTGVGLPWRADTAQHQINRQHSLAGLLPQRPLDTLLPLLGIPTQFATGKMNVLLGDSVLCYAREELAAMLAGGLIVDNLAAEHLCAMGFAPLLGCVPKGKVTGPCVEKITHQEFGGDFCGTYLCTNWEAIRCRGEWITHFEKAEKAIELSCLTDDEKNYLAPASTLFYNEAGGAVCVLALPVQDLGWLFKARSILMQHVVHAMPGGSALPMLSGACNVAPFYYTDAATGEGLLALVNCGLDEETVTLPTFLAYESVLEAPVAAAVSIPPLQAYFYKTKRVEGETK